MTPELRRLYEETQPPLPDVLQPQLEEELADARALLAHLTRKLQGRVRLTPEESQELHGGGDVPPLAVRIRTLEASLQSWERSDDDPEQRDPAHCVCGHASDRRCLGCDTRGCAGCQPQTGGQPCPRCSGPVWGDDEPLSPSVWNPQMKGF